MRLRLALLIPCLVLGAILLFLPPQANGSVHVVVSVGVAPPVLPVYAQPICPGPGYIWQPGYWAYGDDGYFWVPGTWVTPPSVGLLWTPGYWGFTGGLYRWHGGYWGPTVGFYGGINYGFGYTGVGFSGGYWHGRDFYYNRSVTNINTTIIHNTYNRTVINERGMNHVSFNGGRGGIQARPSRAEMAAEHQRHIAMTAAQNRHFEAASRDRSMHVSANHGRPNVAATPRAGELHNGGNAARARNVRENNRPAAANAPRPTPRVAERPQPHAAPARPAASPRPAPARPNASHAPARPNPAPHVAPSRPNNAPARPAVRPTPNNHATPHAGPQARAQNAPRPAPQRAAGRPQQHAPAAHAAPQHQGSGGHPEKPKP